ncbi:MAG: AAA family ATPase [Actinobacteria bacterium]|nr:AAA family ATPase [Actinomycetota bacterium]
MSELDPFSIKRVILLEYQKPIFKRIYNTINWLFSNSYENLPFKGFLLYGPPGTGKSEIVKQVGKKIADAYSDVKIHYVDGADIASPKWGEAEKKLEDVFNVSERERRVIIFDDIESLMMSRGANIAKEWHYSINSVLFHKLDFLDPSKCIVLATTNRIDLVDEALKSRFYLIEIPRVPKEELFALLDKTLASVSLPTPVKEKISSNIREKIRKDKIRDLRQVLYEVAIQVFNYISEEELI